MERAPPDASDTQSGQAIHPGLRRHTALAAGRAGSLRAAHPAHMAQHQVPAGDNQQVAVPGGGDLGGALELHVGVVSCSGAARWWCVCVWVCVCGGGGRPGRHLDKSWQAESPGARAPPETHVGRRRARAPARTARHGWAAARPRGRGTPPPSLHSPCRWSHVCVCACVRDCAGVCVWGGEWAQRVEPAALSARAARAPALDADLLLRDEVLHDYVSHGLAVRVPAAGQAPRGDTPLGGLGGDARCVQLRAQATPVRPPLWRAGKTSQGSPVAVQPVHGAQDDLVHRDAAVLAANGDEVGVRARRQAPHPAAAVRRLSARGFS